MGNCRRAQYREISQFFDLCVANKKQHMKNKFTKKHKHVLIIKGTQGMARLSLAVISRLGAKASSLVIYINSFIKRHRNSSTPRARALSYFGAFLLLASEFYTRASSVPRARILSLLGYRARAILLSFGVVISLMVTLALPTEISRAATSNELNFQGRLLSDTGALIADGVYNMQYDLYYVASGGSTQWTEDRLVTNSQGVTVQNGYFSVYLGEYDAFGALDWSQDLYLGMTIRGTANCAWGSCTPADSEMTPRIKLTSVPYAFVSANVASSDTSTASTNSDAVSITTGDASGVTSNSGNISLDVGTATGTTGTITLGSANASALTLGRAGLTTTNAGALTVIELTTLNGGNRRYLYLQWRCLHRLHWWRTSKHSRSTNSRYNLCNRLLPTRR